MWKHFISVEEKWIITSPCWQICQIAKIEFLAGMLTNSNRRVDVTRGQFHKQVYAQLLQAKVTKVKKRHWWLDCLFAHLGSAPIKAAHKMLMKLTTGVDFTHMFKHSFFVQISQKRIKTVKSLVLRICACKKLLI